MDPRLFSERSIWTMIQGIVLGGGALLALSAALFALRPLRTSAMSDVAAQQQSRHLAWLTVFIAAMLWLTVLVGAYVNFPPYRATPPEGLADLAQYPKSLIQPQPEMNHPRPANVNADPCGGEHEDLFTRNPGSLKGPSAIIDPDTRDPQPDLISRGSTCRICSPPNFPVRAGASSERAQPSPSRSRALRSC